MAYEFLGSTTAGSSGNSGGDTLGMVGGLLSGATSAFGNVANVVQGIKNYELQENELAKKWAYTDWARAHGEQREDSAIQRRVADLRSAGLSPTLAAGSPADAKWGSAVNTPAPQLNIGHMENPVNASLDALTRYLQQKQTAASISQTEAQTKLLEQQREFNNASMGQRVKQIELNNNSKELANSLLSQTLDIKVSKENENLLAIKLDNQYNNQTLNARVEQALQQVEINDLIKANKAMDLKLAELDITKDQIENARNQLQYNLEKSRYDTTDRQITLDLLVKMQMLKSLELANQGKESSNQSGRSKAMTDTMNAQFWQAAGIAPDAAKILADQVGNILGAIK